MLGRCAGPNRSPGAPTCAKLGGFVQGGDLEPTHLFAQSNVALTRPHRQTAGCAALSPGRKMIKMIESFARVRRAITTAQKKFRASSGGTSKAREPFR
jgi:hypothetical protein